MGDLQVEKSSVPVIDLLEFGDSLASEAYKKLREACEEWGCFRIVNHGISLNLMEEMKEVVRSLLDRPIEIKRRNTDAIAGSGYVAPSAVNPLYEALGLYDFGSPEALCAFCDQLDALPHQRFAFFLSLRKLKIKRFLIFWNFRYLDDWIFHQDSLNLHTFLVIDMILI